MLEIPFERLPDILIGKIWESGIVCESTIGLDTDGALSLFVSPIRTLSPHDPHFSEFVNEVIGNSVEFFHSFSALVRLIIETEIPSPSFSHQRCTVRLTAEMIRSHPHSNLSLDLISDIHPCNCFDDPTTDWLSLQKIDKENPLTIGPTPAGYRQVPQLDRLPWIEVGRLRARGLNIDRAYIYHDKDDELTLYFSYPLGSLEESDKTREELDMLKIVDCSVLTFTHYPELQRLEIWTRPDLADKVGIPSLWFTRSNLLKYSAGELSSSSLLASAKDHL